LRKRLGKLLSNWFKKKEGSTAIEFSLLAIPYVFLTVGIIELGIMYAAASLLEGATASAARLIRTGQIQQAVGDPEQMFRDAICGYATVLINCNDIVLEVIPLASFADFSGPTYDANGNMVSAGFDAGGVSDNILIRVSYRYTMMTPFIGPLLAGPDSSHLFVSTIVLQTEPYDFQGV